MSKIEELIERLCPKGVEFRKLGKFCEIKTGAGITKKDTVENGKYKIISGGIEPLGLCNIYNRKSNTVTIARAGSAGFVNYIAEKFYLNDKCFSIIPNDSMNSKFLYYALKNIQENIYSLKSSGTVPTINTEKVANICIPVPPLEVQCEIVHILDDFTLLSAELSAELKARQKQYEYYRDTLLKGNNEIPKLKLGEFAQIIRGGNFQKKDFVDKGKPCIHYGQIYTHYGISAEKTITYLSDEEFEKSKKASSGDIIMAVTSENLQDVCKSVAWLGGEEVAVSGHIAIIKHNQNPKYLSYYFSSSMFFNQKQRLAHGTKVIEVTPNSLADIEIPIPSMEMQNKLVKVLDNFDAICSDLKIGLPAEIEKRQKQYEFYRDVLLTYAATGEIIFREEKRREEKRREEKRREEKRREEKRREEKRLLD